MKWTKKREPIGQTGRTRILYLSPCGRWEVQRARVGGWTASHCPMRLSTSLYWRTLREAKAVLEAMSDALGPVGAIDQDHDALAEFVRPFVSRREDHVFATVRLEDVHQRVTA